MTYDYTQQGTAYDPGAAAHELVGRKSRGDMMDELAGDIREDGAIMVSSAAFPVPRPEYRGMVWINADKLAHAERYGWRAVTDAKGPLVIVAR